MKLNEVVKALNIRGDCEVEFWDVQDGKFTKAYKKIYGDFRARGSKETYFLRTLEGGPSWVNENFRVDSNLLSNLKYGPTYVGGTYECGRNMLTSIEDAAQEIGGNFYCNTNSIESLEGIGRKYLKKMNGNFVIYNNHVKRNVLGVILIHGIQEFRIYSFALDKGVFKEAKQLQEIITAHLERNDRDMLDLQEDLITAGLKDYAKL